MKQISAIKFIFYCVICFACGIVIDRAYLIDWEAQALNTRFCVAAPPTRAEDLRFLFGE